MFTTTVVKKYVNADKGYFVLEVTKKFLGVTYSRVEHYLES